MPRAPAEWMAEYPPYVFALSSGGGGFSGLDEESHSAGNKLQRWHKTCKLSS